MQEFILVISRCVSIRKKCKNKGHLYHFHFKGSYAGQRIKSINVRAREDYQLSKGNDYLLWIRFQKIEQGILEADLIKFKKII